VTLTPISPSIIGEREKFLIYGEPGTGKTFDALTAPAPIFFLAVGGSNEAKTYYSKQFQKKHGKKEIFISVAEESTDASGKFDQAQGFDNACRLMDEALEEDDKGTTQFATIVIDNATVLEEYQMNKVIEVSHSGVASKGRDTSQTTYQKYQDSGILTPFDSDWGAAQSLMAKYLSWLFRLDKHIVLVAHEYQDTTTNRATQSREITGIKPLFVGNQRGRVANMFDNVWRKTKSGQLYVARTEPLDRPFPVIAKTRIGGIIPADYSNVDLTDVIDQFQEHAKNV
jgi:hypothetical protein